MDRLISTLREADHVLIAGGAGISADAGNSYTDEVAFRKRFPAMAERGFRYPYQFIGYRAWSPELKWGYMSSFDTMIRNLPVAPVYTDLLSILTDLEKDYFVITTNVDNLFHRHGFDLNRIYTPQGQFANMQCLSPSTCSREVWPSAPQVAAMYANVDFSTQELQDSNLVPKCPRCGGDCFFNVNGGRWFVHDAYQNDAEKFAKWVQETSDRGESLLILEIGVGFNTPGVIRFRNERIVARHPNVTFVRVNPVHFQVSPPIIDKSVSLKMTAAEMVQRLREEFLDDEE